MSLNPYVNKGIEMGKKKILGENSLELGEIVALVIAIVIMKGMGPVKAIPEKYRIWSAFGTLVAALCIW